LLGVTRTILQNMKTENKEISQIKKHPAKKMEVMDCFKGACKITG